MEINWCVQKEVVGVAATARKERGSGSVKNSLESLKLVIERRLGSFGLCTGKM
jgi:hypothetical protein